MYYYYADDTLAGNSRWNPAPERGKAALDSSASFRGELQQNLR